jgi:Fur family peroxide stress response transcriptional regulator
MTTSQTATVGDRAQTAEPEAREPNAAPCVAPNELEARVERFEQAAREAGIRMTHQRLVIFRAVASRIDHPSAEAIHRVVQETMPTVSLDTVYRTLWMLTDLGLLTTIGPRQNTVRFDPKVGTHHHFICTACGAVRDFESAALDALPIPEHVKGFGQIASAQVEVRGVCEECTRERTAE